MSLVNLGVSRNLSPCRQGGWWFWEAAVSCANTEGEQQGFLIARWHPWLTVAKSRPPWSHSKPRREHPRWDCIPLSIFPAPPAADWWYILRLPSSKPCGGVCAWMCWMGLYTCLCVTSNFPVCVCACVGTWVNRGRIINLSVEGSHGETSAMH